MSKKLWKSLLISPALLSAALLVSTDARAAQTQTAKDVSQPQTAQAEIKETQSVAIAVAPVAPAVKANTEFSTAAKEVKDLAVDTTTVAAKSSDLTAAQPESASAKQNVVPTVESKLAQATPATGATESAPVDTRNMDQMLRYSNEGSSSKDSLGQVTNVSQFRDVQPSDWAYEALSQIVQKYGCLQGYPDGTYRGNRALSRYEFAAGLNACLRQIEALIGNQPESVSRRDFEALQRLTEEFRTELATLGTRVDNLEGRTAFLEQRQFSTTTKLAGEAIFAYTDSIDDRNSPGILGDRIRLDLRTSFTGRDTLHTRLAAGNLSNPIQDYYPDIAPNAGGFGTFEGTQTFNINRNGGNNVSLDWLGYYFPFGGSKVYLTATGGTHGDYAATNNPYFEDYDGGNGALSTFAQESPIYRIGGGAGGAITLGLGKGSFFLRPTSLTVGYLADNANNPAVNNGLFNGSYAALGQLNFSVSDRVGLAFTYVRGYHTGGDSIFDLGRSSGQTIGAPVVGTQLANNPFLLTGANNESFRTNSYGISAAIRPSNSFSLSGYVTTTYADGANAQANIWSYGAGIALPNFGRQGNVLGIFAGVEPTLTGLKTPGGNFVNIPNRENAYHLEGFYKYQLTDNISVTPGVIWLTNPGQSANSPDAIIGTLRTTFIF
jgi:BMFP domain-containing protein YqiC